VDAICIHYHPVCAGNNFVCEKTYNGTNGYTLSCKDTVSAEQIRSADNKLTCALVDDVTSPTSQFVREYELQFKMCCELLKG